MHYQFTQFEGEKQQKMCTKKCRFKDIKNKIFVKKSTAKMSVENVENLQRT
jgi:hypothetical protein